MNVFICERNALGVIKWAAPKNMGAWESVQHKDYRPHLLPPAPGGATFKIYNWRGS
jgi:hypothetical protein